MNTFTYTYYMFLQPKFRVRQRNRFQLDTQESQWTGQVALNSFQPYDPDLKGKAINDYDSYDENEPEIITAENEPAEVLNSRPHAIKSKH